MESGGGGAEAPHYPKIVLVTGACRFLGGYLTAPAGIAAKLLGSTSTCSRPPRAPRPPSMRKALALPGMLNTASTLPTRSVTAIVALMP